MPKLNVFIDGSWLFKICGSEGVLASKTDRSSRHFSLDFSKLNSSLLDHAKRHDEACAHLGSLFYATSIFELPADYDDWANTNDDITEENLAITRRNVHSRNTVANNAINAGYSDTAVFRPTIKTYIIRKLREKRYQEKQVDTTVVALLVKEAIVNPTDYHAVIAGDADILPAIKVAYPEYSRNVFIATSHPDELSANHRHTSFSLNNFDFDIEPYYLQDHIAEIVYGNHAHHCANCNIVFTTNSPIPARARPYCTQCQSRKT